MGMPHAADGGGGGGAGGGAQLLLLLLLVLRARLSKLVTGCSLRPASSYRPKE